MAIIKEIRMKLHRVPGKKGMRAGRKHPGCPWLVPWLCHIRGHCRHSLWTRGQDSSRNDPNYGGQLEVLPCCLNCCGKEQLDLQTHAGKPLPQPDWEQHHQHHGGLNSLQDEEKDLGDNNNVGNQGDEPKWEGPSDIWRDLCNIFVAKLDVLVGKNCVNAVKNSIHVIFMSNNIFAIKSSTESQINHFISGMDQLPRARKNIEKYFGHLATKNIMLRSGYNW